MVEKSNKSSNIWVSPTRPEVRRHELAIVKEIVQNFDVDGLRLDHVRYENDWQDWSNYSKQLFQSDTGINPDELQQGNNSGWITWIDWRAEKITSFIEDVTDELSSIRPIEVGAYLLPHSARKDGYHNWSGSGQDYEKLGNAGIDIMPMVYWQDWTSRDKFEEWTYNKTHYSKELSQSNVIPVFSITTETNETYWGKAILEDSEVETYLIRSSQITRNNDINELSLFYYYKWGSYETERAINSFSFHQDFDPIVDILSPKNGEENAAYVGAFGNPHDSIEVHIWVMDKNENEGVTGLSEDDFTFKIGEKEAIATLIGVVP